MLNLQGHRPHQPCPVRRSLLVCLTHGGRKRRRNSHAVDLDALLADVLTEARIAELKEAFSLFDEEADGKIQISELGVILRALGLNPTPEELSDLHQLYDADGSGSLDFPEFLHLIANYQSEDNVAEELKKLFALLDTNKSGTVELAELCQVLSCVGECMESEELLELLREADTDGNGVINYDEFVGESAAAFAPTAAGCPRYALARAPPPAPQTCSWDRWLLLHRSKLMKGVRPAAL